MKQHNEQRYLELCAEAATLNTCTFVDGQCGSQQYPNGCCTRCTHLAPEAGGCQVNSLVCKLWMCDHLRDTLPEETLTRLQEIWNEARPLGMLVVRDEPEHASTWAVRVQEPCGRWCTSPLSDRTD